jgi:hypothetical protein
VNPGIEHGIAQRLDDVRGRPGLGIAPPEIDERLAARGCCSRDSSEESDEVLLGQPIEALGARAHSEMVLGRRRAVGNAVHRYPPAARRRLR